MSKQELISLRNELFDSDFNLVSNDVDKIVIFCKELTDKTGIQACNVFGYVNELTPKLYASVINSK